MKLTERLKQSMEGLIYAVMRYPLTSIFLIATAVVNGVSIQISGFDQYDRLLATCIVGVLVSLVAQGVYERFFTEVVKRWLLALGAVIVTGLYYLTMINAPDFSLIISIRTAVLVFALVIAFIWIPTIKSKLVFDQSFLIVFKAFFTSGFFALVIMLGVSLILGATDQLLFNIGYRAYPHAGNIIFAVFAPMYFLSLIPRYYTDKQEVEQRVTWSRFLEILVAYIIIPLVSVFTVILVLYILLNIRGEFWTDNLLEPMLVTYSIIVIFVYILGGTLENKLGNQFKRIFPKVLVPIVLFQTLASFLKIQEEGLTHGRYFVILYGIFAIISGVLFSIYKGKKNGVVALLLIVLSIISIVPPVDAFSVSRRSQITQLEEVLMDNGMLINGEIQRATEISEEDQRIISNITSYMSRMNYTEEISWIPENFDYYSNFEEVFGFSPYVSQEGMEVPIYRNFYRSQQEVIEISNYDYMIQAQFSNNGEDRGPGQDFETQEIGFSGETYEVGWGDVEEREGFYLKDSQNNPVLFIDIEEVVIRFEGRDSRNQPITQEEATFYARDNGKSMAVIVNFLDIQDQEGQEQYSGDVYILVGMEN